MKADYPTKFHQLMLTLYELIVYVLLCLVYIQQLLTHSHVALLPIPTTMVQPLLVTSSTSLTSNILTFIHANFLEFPEIS